LKQGDILLIFFQNVKEKCELEKIITEGKPYTNTLACIKTNH